MAQALKERKAGKDYGLELIQAHDARRNENPASYQIAGHELSGMRGR
jgi:hypothetical protein